MSHFAQLGPRGFARRLRDDRSGVAFTEFALSLPILLVFMASGLELANYVLAVKRAGEIAAMVADNASRMGDQTVLVNKPITEAEINDVFIGANLHGGTLDLEKNGRIILSSLQQDEDDKQSIKWQRCFGELPHPSSYGKEGDSGFTAMGPAGEQVMAAKGTAVMVVEVTYKYKRLVPLIQLPLGDITDFAAFNVRDSRDLSGVGSVNGVEKSECK